MIEEERDARVSLLEQSGMRLEDRIYLSYGELSYSRIVESKAAARCLSDIRLGIDLDIIKDVQRTILNELVVLTQPGFLQQYAQKTLTAMERDVLRASLIRERMRLE